ncbi:MAG: response regulator transcription factor, partial [Sulfurimonadaceae bacterium]|nr:response regulator transcription factor [Sulfurimonadaceae bacterium]
LETLYAEVYEARTAEDAYEIYKAKQPHIMIIDINLPKMSGLEFLEKIRETDHNTKAIMLTAYTDTDKLIKAASLKLTCYLTKPIARRNLQSSLELCIKEIASYEIKSLQKIELGNGYSWDSEKNEFFYHEERVALTKKEQKLLALLFSSLNRTFTYDEIFDYVWGYEQIGTLDGLKSLIKTLRKKIPKEYVQNIFGIGYKINI